MAENSKIEWTTHTFNPWRGCTKVAAGCANCYAEALSKRNPTTLGEWGPNGTRVVASEAMWREPVKWNKAAACIESFDCANGSHSDACPQANRPRVFCASLADVFEDWRGNDDQKNVYASGDSCLYICNGKFTTSANHTSGDEFRLATLNDVRARLFELIDDTPNLDWLLLTKRPQNIRRMWPMVREAILPDVDPGEWFRPNCWLGTSIANQGDLEKNLPEMLDARDLAPVRFLSCEPLLGPLSFALRTDGTGSVLTAAGINWVIVGGESGPHSRPCNVEWIRSIVAHCKEHSVACFMKQLGADPMIDHGYREGIAPRFEHFKTVNPKGGDWSEWPEDLRVREFPQGTAPEAKCTT